MKGHQLTWKKIVTEAEGLSQAEIVRAVDDAVKSAILDEKNSVSTDDILYRLHERHGMRSVFLDVESS